MMVDKKTFAIGVLSLSALVLVVANLLAPRPAAATYETEHDANNYIVQTATSPRGGDAVFVTDVRTGKMAVFGFDVSRRTLVLQDVQPVQSAFAPLMRK